MQTKTFNGKISFVNTLVTESYLTTLDVILDRIKFDANQSIVIRIPT